jgi:hypothetical protein
MKKLFTLFAATLVSACLFAQTTEKSPADPASVTADVDLVGVSYTIPAAQVAGGGSKIVGDMWDKGVKVRTNKKHNDISNALPFLVNEGKKITGIKIVGVTNKEAVTANFTSAIVDGQTISISGSLPGKDGTASGIVEIQNIEAFESVIFISDGNGGQALICYEVTYDDATPSVDPVLSVNPEAINLAVTLTQKKAFANVTFTGKNLTPGNYSLTIPNLAGFAVDPDFVTVGEDGKLNQSVTLSYESNVNVEEGLTSISLEINQLKVEVPITYSANVEGTYEYASSVNIEQWVLDNGKDNAAFQAVLNDAHIDFENINELDSLNDAKDLRNEPFLGLKLKKQGAFVALWLKEGSTVRVKFGKVNDPVIGSINGETETFTPEFLERPLEFTAPADCYMKLTTTSDKTIVIKQVMIDQEIAEVILPESPQGVENISNETTVNKFIENGQLYIIKNNVRYNAQGAVVK